ncbi:MAG: SpoIIE family protein phosphatase [Planctomycetes bacterium]|nr:SpoIIE family protein phosphatase [Planctomycetota bacterium]
MPGRRLVVVSERDHRFLDLDDMASVSVGRSPENDIIVKDDMVSRRHCVIERAPEGGYRVRDLKSFNGTYLNDNRVREEPFRLWDAVRVGRTKIVLVDRIGEPGETPAPESNGAPAPEGPASEKVLSATRTMDSEVDLPAALRHPEVRTVIDDLLRREREKTEHEVGRRIRDESAPASLGTFDHLALRALRYGPMDGGGDFYDALSRGPHDALLAVGSVSGVGVAASVAATAARHTLRGLLAVAAEEPPHELAGLLREALRGSLHPGSAVSAVLAQITGGTQVRLGAVGGAGALLYHAATAEVRVLRAPGRRDEEALRPEDHSVVLSPGDRLLLASDGAGALRRVGTSEAFGAEQLQATFAAEPQLPAKELLQKLAKALEAHADNAPDRDGTFLLVEPA